MSAMKRMLENEISTVAEKTGIDEMVLYDAYADICYSGDIEKDFFKAITRFVYKYAMKNLSLKTGYEEDFLWERFDKACEDYDGEGSTPFELVYTISLEKDW